MQKALPMKQISITWRNVSVYSNALALLSKIIRRIAKKYKISIFY